MKSYVNGTLKINECLFDCPDKISKPLYTTTGTPLAVMTQPQTNITYAGIELHNTWPSPTPGFSSLPITYTVFQNLANGILLNHSSLILRGSRFTNVLLTSVEAKSGVNDSRFPILNIETSNAFEELGHNNNPSASLPANSIKGIGVLVNGNYELLCGKSNGGPNVFHNYFRNVDAWAIRTQFTKGKTHTIQKNQFSNINWTAISMYENTSTSGLFLPSYLSNILIKENKIENPACPWATAITIEDVISSSKGQTQVQRNTISNSRNGVLVTNRANPQIQENNITMSGWKDEKSRNRGIYTVNCISTNYTSTATQLYILNNFVGMYSNVIASYLDVGLEIKQCPGAMIKFNTFNKTGRGIWYEGNNEKNTLACNRLISNDIGLLLIYSSSIGNQGSPTSVHNNEWHPVSGNLYDTYVEGSQGSIIYFKGSNAYPYSCPVNRNVDNSGAGLYFRFFQANNNAQSLCNFIPTLQKKDLYVALKNASPTPLVNERKWQSNFELARNFQYDSTLLSLDADFQLWSDSIQQTTTGKLANVHQSITNNDISLAKTQNQQINCACTNEHYLKQTNQIYLESFASGIDTFDANQRSILEMIAALNSIEHGHGVIQARVMLKAIGDTTQYADPLTGPGIPQGSNKMAPQELNQDKNIKIYPNPAQDEVLFENAEDASVQLFDFTGKLVLETEVKEGKINVASVPNGMYIVNLFKDKVQILQTKLSIQK